MSTILGQRGMSGERCIRIGLVNNMPDAALGRTERQFRNLLTQAAPDISVQFSLFSLYGLPRSETGLRHLETSSYRNAEEIAGSPFDAFVVTGTEPRQENLEDEPYWGAMKRLFNRLEQARRPVIFSCLAAHAAVLHFNGLRRQRLPQKRFGVFEHVRACRHELTDGLAPVVRVAHSRCNEIAPESLEQKGYRVLTVAADAGADLFVKQGRETWLFCQGHPEYDPDALGREYQRDVRRFLARERDSYPCLPQNYFESTDVECLTVFERRARTMRSEAMMAEFPPLSRSQGRDEMWAPATAGVFGTWLQNIARDKAAASVRNHQWSGDRGRAAVLTPSARRRRLAQLSMLQG
jgi:homoserine O-succinyltransferase